MILSCHVPKTAGTSFGRLLSQFYGNRLVFDYGDRVGWTGPEAEAWRASRALPDRVLSGTVEIVHGHFYPTKYLRLFPDASVVAFVREPVDRVISNYRFLASHADIDHPLVAEFHRRSPSLIEWAGWPWARDLQSKVLAGLAVEELALVGLTERYRKSLERFDARFGSSLAELDTGEQHNQSEGNLHIPPEVRAAIAALNRADAELYRCALAIFEASTTQR